MKYICCFMLAICFLAQPGWSAPDTTAPVQFATKKIFYINAYSPGYVWSDAEQGEMERVLHEAGVQYQSFYMSSKDHKKPEEIHVAASKAHDLIESFKPDVLIVSDDNPVAHVVVPWYKNSSLPVVFCGVNWDCSHYGLPCTNVTGMLEVSLFSKMLQAIYPFARGKRVGILTDNNETDHLEGAFIPKRCNLPWAAEKYVNSFAEWKQNYLAMQDQVDILFLYGTAGMSDWNEEEAEAFVRANTRIMTCGTQYYMRHLVVVGYMKSAEEQGHWAAQTALRILSGTPPSAIPVAENKVTILTLNMTLAKKLGVVFPLDMVNLAELVH